jgi:protein-disulfide isomerase
MPVIQNLKNTFKKIFAGVKKHNGQITLVISVLALAASVYSIYEIKNLPTQAIANLPSGGITGEAAEKIQKELPDYASVMGNPKAKVTIVEFGDFQCPFCGKFFKESFSEIKKQYIDTGKVKFVFLNYAFLGQESTDAAEASLCAQDQGKYWEYHDQLFLNQKGENLGTFSDEKLKEIASSINLNVNEFDSCRSTDKRLKDVYKDFELGKKYGITGTPAFLIGKQVIKGAVPMSNFKQAIDSQL